MPDENKVYITIAANIVERKTEEFVAQKITKWNNFESQKQLLNQLFITGEVYTTTSVIMNYFEKNSIFPNKTSYCFSRSILEISPDS